MKKCFLIIVFSLFIFYTTAYAEMAKQGNGNYRSGKTGTYQVLAMEKKQFQINFEETGVVVEAPKDSPLFNSSFRSLGSSVAHMGKWKGNLFIIYTRPNGDKVYGTYRGQGVVRGSSSGVITFIGGTGTCTGIGGSLEITNTPGLKSPKKGTYVGITVGKFNWKIP